MGGWNQSGSEWMEGRRGGEKICIQLRKGISMERDTKFKKKGKESRVFWDGTELVSGEIWNDATGKVGSYGIW